jgi:hypothetical protein
VALADGVGRGADDRVDDDETLYRSVKRILWKQKNDGGFYLSSQAFADRNRRPSVDRAKVCGHDPSYTQFRPSDYVCSLVAEDVRAIASVVKHDKKGVSQVRHNIDVEPVPLADNDAHAEIYAVPEISGGRLFERLLERLAYLARWECGFGPE